MCNADTASANVKEGRNLALTADSDTTTIT